LGPPRKVYILSIGKKILIEVFPFKSNILQHLSLEKGAAPAHAKDQAGIIVLPPVHGIETPIQVTVVAGNYYAGSIYDRAFLRGVAPQLPRDHADGRVGFGCFDHDGYVIVRYHHIGIQEQDTVAAACVNCLILTSGKSPVDVISYDRDMRKMFLNQSHGVIVRGVIHYRDLQSRIVLVPYRGKAFQNILFAVPGDNGDRY
jgi:hypothetical protein